MRNPLNRFHRHPNAILPTHVESDESNSHDNHTPPTPSSHPHHPNTIQQTHSSKETRVPEEAGNLDDTGEDALKPPSPISNQNPSPSSTLNDPTLTRKQRKQAEKEEEEKKERERERDVYDRFTKGQKKVITLIAGCAAFVGPITSSSFLPSIPQIAHDVGSTADVINYTVAIFVFMIGLAPLIWSPMSGYYGRKPIYLASLPIFVGASIGVARATSVVGLIIGRIFQAIGSSSVLSVGAGTIGDVYRPTERARAMGIFYSGVVLGPAISPVIAGVFQEYTPQTWRSMQYCLAGLGALAVGLVALFLPETTHGEVPHERMKRERGAKFVWYWFNPLKAVLLLRWPNITLISLSSAAAMLTTYAVLVPLSTIFKTRYNISNAAILGCLYLAPGVGNILGTRLAGRMADNAVKKWMVKRGYRRAEDRLKATIIGSAFVMPASLLGVGWLVQTGAGGVYAPLVFYLINGVALMLVVSPSNVYLVDASQTRSAECIAINNFIRYVAAAAASAGVLPCVNAIGIGWTNTLAAGISLFGTVCILLTLRYGSKWRETANAKHGVTYKEADEMTKEDLEAAAANALDDKEKGEEDSEKTMTGSVPMQPVKSRLPEVHEVLSRTYSSTHAHH